MSLLKKTMDLRIFTLLIVSYNVAYAHNSHDGSMPPTEPTTAMPRASEPQDCQELYSSGITTDGEYTIYVDGAPMQVYCDMTTGGWIILQKRTDGSVDYNRYFNDYEEGFGNVSAEHWLGLQKMHMLTASTANCWIVRFDLANDEDEHHWARYNDFRIAAGNAYTMTFNEETYIGTLNDYCYPTPDGCINLGLTYHNGMKFSAQDLDQDLDAYRDCAKDYDGGWWYGGCLTVITTGTPYNSNNDHAIFWADRRAQHPATSAIIKIKKSSICRP